MNYCLTLIIFCSITSAVFAQNGDISGTVTDYEGNTIIGASVKLREANKATVTDENGKFRMSEVKYGTYTLLISSITTEPKTVTVMVQSQNTQVNQQVKTTERQLKNVVVTGRTQKKEIETSGFAVNVIETKEASLRNLTTNELLDRTVGVRVRQNGGEGSRIEYNLNGMSGNTIGLFIDGIEMSTYGSSFNLNNIPPSMIERIEVYKGVLPAHLSGNYIGGAINVIMKKDASANNITASTSYGSFNTYRADLSGLLRNSSNGLTLRASGFYSSSDNDYEMWGKFSKFTLPGGRIIRNYRTKRPNDRFETIGGRFELGFTDVKWADQFFIGYNVSDSYKEIPHGITMTKPYFGRYNEYSANVFSLNYAKKDLLVNGLAVNINALHSRRNTLLHDTVSLRYNWDGSLLVKNSEGPPETYGPILGKGQQDDAIISDIDRNISNIRSNLSYNIFSGHRISLNHNFERTDREDKDLLNPGLSRWITGNDLTTNIWAMNYELEILDGKLRTNIFGKHATYKTDQTRPVAENNGVMVYSKSSTVRNNQGYGGTLSYEPIKSGFLIISAEKSFIMPTDRHIYGEPENNLLPNPGILPEMAVNYNLGARYNVPAFDKHRFSIYGNAFWRNGYDKIIRQTRVEPVIEGRENQVEDIQATQFVNLSKTQSVGFEAELNYIFDNRLNANLNFSRFNSLFKVKKDERGNPHSLYDRQVPNEPFFTVNAHVDYSIDNVFQKQSIFNLYYSAGFVAPFNTVWIESEWFTTPTQFAHDLGASYRFPRNKLVASLDCKNMLNAEVYDNFGVQKPGRAFYVKINYTINNFNK